MKNTPFYFIAIILSITSCANTNQGLARIDEKKIYLDGANGNDQNDGLSSSSPWKTLDKLGKETFKAGDTIFFAKGSSFTSGCVINSSGTSEKPIVLTAYGSGDAPSFSNPDYKLLNGNVFQVKGSHITIDGLLFKACANAPTVVDKEILLVGAVYGVTGSDYLIVKNCQFVDCPIGIYVNGQHCTITKNTLQDCNRFLSDPDWGPIGIVIGNAYNDVSFNSCTNYIHVGGNFGADGGFIELEDRYFGNKVHHVNIHHNYSVANMGFVEIEGKVTGDSLNVYYNFSDDFQQFVFFWGGNHSSVDNNTVIRIRPSKNGAVNTVFTMRNGDFTLRNNIFIVANNVQVLVSAPYNIGNYGKVVHLNNLYYCIDGSVADPCGKPLGNGEKIANPTFVNKDGFAYGLGLGSPAIGAGLDLNYSSDLFNKPLPTGGSPDLGACQYQ